MVDLTEPLHDQIQDAIAALLATDAFFPPIELDAPEPANLRSPVPGATSAIRDHCTVQCEDEPPEVTRDGGAELDWELEGKYSIVYLVAGGAVAERRAFRNAAISHVQALIAANRTLGIADPQIYAELGPSERGNEVVVKGTAGCAIALIPVTVQYVAQSAAG